ncbi:MAG: fibronectin type III domain-containing protein [Candidatus Gracilibacteria bacterium]|nr:fibronectin type III domain-containing protein [Candidatus Gracilibacteria bacterium]
MKYIKYVAMISLLSISTAALAATDVTSTGVITDTATVATTTSLEVKGAPRLIKKTADSVTLEWDKVVGADSYIVKYSKTSVAGSTDPNAQYDNESDQVTTTGAVITSLSSTKEKLAPATAYYFSVVAIDKDGKESDTFSDELMVTTDAAGTTTATTSGATATLSVAGVTVTDDRTLAVAFNMELGADPVTVKITKTSDNSDVAVGLVTPDTTKKDTVIVSTIAALSPTTSYTLTVLSAKDVVGNSIQEGVSGLKEFSTPATMVAGLAAAGTESGATLSGSVTPEVTTTVATGAGTNLLVLAALLLSLGVVYIYRKKLV